MNKKWSCYGKKVNRKGRLGISENRREVYVKLLHFEIHKNELETDPLQVFRIFSQD